MQMFILASPLASLAAEPPASRAPHEAESDILGANANYVTLMQPIYRIAAHRNVTGVRLTANVWKMELAQVRPE